MRCTGAVVFEIENATGVDARLLPAASYAVATSVWDPFDSVFESSVIEYGDDASEPFSTPSTRNSTFVTPTLSEAVADSVIVPLVPDSDALTVGCVVSPPAPCVTQTGADQRILPSSCVTFAQ